MHDDDDLNDDGHAGPVNFWLIHPSINLISHFFITNFFFPIGSYISPSATKLV